MTATLYPTKTRLALLRAVADGAVTEHYPLLPSPSYSQLDRGEGDVPRYLKVTAAVADQKRAGWIQLGNRIRDHFHAPRQWVVTDEGRRVLDAAGVS